MILHIPLKALTVSVDNALYVTTYTSTLTSVCSSIAYAIPVHVVTLISLLSLFIISPQALLSFSLNHILSHILTLSLFYTHTLYVSICFSDLPLLLFLSVSQRSHILLSFAYPHYLALHVTPLSHTPSLSLSLPCLYLSSLHVSVCQFASLSAHMYICLSHSTLPFTPISRFPLSLTFLIRLSFSSSVCLFACLSRFIFY